MALEVGHHSHRLALRVIDPEDDQFPVYETVRIAANSGRTVAAGADPAVDVDGPESPAAVHVRGFQPSVGFGDQSRNLVNEPEAVALGPCRLAERGRGPADPLPD